MTDLRLDVSQNLYEEQILQEKNSQDHQEQQARGPQHGVEEENEENEENFAPHENPLNIQNNNDFGSTTNSLSLPGNNNGHVQKPHSAAERVMYLKNKWEQGASKNKNFNETPRYFVEPTPAAHKSEFYQNNPPTFLLPSQTAQNAAQKTPRARGNAAVATPRAKTNSSSKSNSNSGITTTTTPRYAPSPSPSHEDAGGFQGTWNKAAHVNQSRHVHHQPQAQPSRDSTKPNNYKAVTASMPITKKPNKLPSHFATKHSGNDVAAASGQEPSSSQPAATISNTQSSDKGGEQGFQFALVKMQNCDKAIKTEQTQTPHFDKIRPEVAVDAERKKDDTVNGHSSKTQDKQNIPGSFRLKQYDSQFLFSSEASRSDIRGTAHEQVQRKEGEEEGDDEDDDLSPRLRRFQEATNGQQNSQSRRQSLGLSPETKRIYSFYFPGRRMAPLNPEYAQAYRMHQTNKEQSQLLPSNSAFESGNHIHSHTHHTRHTQNKDSKQASLEPPQDQDEDELCLENVNAAYRTDPADANGDDADADVEEEEEENESIQWGTLPDVSNMTGSFEVGSDHDRTYANRSQLSHQEEHEESLLSNQPCNPEITPGTEFPYHKNFHDSHDNNNGGENSKGKKAQKSKTSQNRRRSFFGGRRKTSDSDTHSACKRYGEVQQDEATEDSTSELESLFTHNRPSNLVRNVSDGENASLQRETTVPLQSQASSTSKNGGTRTTKRRSILFRKKNKPNVGESDTVNLITHGITLAKDENGAGEGRRQREGEGEGEKAGKSGREYRPQARFQADHERQAYQEWLAEENEEDGEAGEAGDQQQMNLDTASKQKRRLSIFGRMTSGENSKSTSKHKSMGKSKDKRKSKHRGKSSAPSGRETSSTNKGNDSFNTLSSKSRQSDQKSSDNSSSRNGRSRYSLFRGKKRSSLPTSSSTSAQALEALGELIQSETDDSLSSPALSQPENSPYVNPIQTSSNRRRSRFSLRPRLKAKPALSSIKELPESTLPSSSSSYGEEKAQQQQQQQQEQGRRQHEFISASQFQSQAGSSSAQRDDCPTHAPPSNRKPNAQAPLPPAQLSFLQPQSATNSSNNNNNNSSTNKRGSVRVLLGKIPRPPALPFRGRRRGARKQKNKNNKQEGDGGSFDDDAEEDDEAFDFEDDAWNPNALEHLCLEGEEGSVMATSAFKPLNLSKKKIIVLDNGSGTCILGFAGEPRPRVDFPAIVGREKHNRILSGIDAPDDNELRIFVGGEAQRKRGVLKLRYPLEHGIIQHWDDMERVWRHAFYNEMRVDPSRHPVLLTEAPLNPKAHRERMVGIMIESFNVPAVYVSVQAVLSLYAAGKRTGVVLDAGDGVTHTVPVFDGYTLPHAIKRIDLAGRDLTLHMTKLLQESGNSFTTTAEHEIVRRMKEEVCYVALDVHAEEEKAKYSAALERQFELPDGGVVVVARERFMCPEALFDPTLIYSDAPGVHQVLIQTVELCDPEMRHDLYSSIVLSGGTTMFPGIAERIEMEISRILAKHYSQHSYEVDVTAPENRRYSVWCGGSLLSTVESFQQRWISRGEYRALGARVVGAKCY